GEFIPQSHFHNTVNRFISLNFQIQSTGDSGYGINSNSGIFSGCGITEAYSSKSSVHGMEQTIELAQKDFHGICFVNLVDFDALWGHRRDPKGYAEELERFDSKLGELLKVLGEEDLLMITADHGNDPTYTGSDHTREKVPLLLYSRSMEHGGPLPEADTFAVVGATAAENFGAVMPEGALGHSLLK
ncbi:MAG: phosphopentomutase, partial [Clostridium sp.]|nr:phosphopentomutase [Clostridium sp.]